MIGINKAPIVVGLETIFTRVLAGISPKAIGRGETIAVIFQNPLTNADGTANNSEIFVGSASNMIYFMIPGQESPVIYAEDLKDVYIKLNFPAVNPNGGVLTAAVEEPGAGYTVGDVLTLLTGSGTAEVTVLELDGHILSISSVDTAGTGYLPGDVLSVSAGDGNGQITVDTVGGAGEVLTAHVSQAGFGYANGSTPATTGGSGDGTANFTLVASTGIFTISVTTPGTGYLPGVVPTTGGTGAGATVNILTVETVIAEHAEITCLIYRLRKGGKQ